jgi:hypothetical protein
VRAKHLDFDQARQGQGRFFWGCSRLNLLRNFWPCYG